VLSCKKGTKKTVFKKMLLLKRFPSTLIILLLFFFMGKHRVVFAKIPSSGQFTVLRPGWGVVFERVSQVVDIGGSGTHFHLWSLKIPNLMPFQLPTINCIELERSHRNSNPALNELCEDMNRNIEETSLTVFEIIARARIDFFNTLEAIPDTENPEKLRQHQSPYETAKSSRIVNDDDDDDDNDVSMNTSSSPPPPSSYNNSNSNLNSSSADFDFDFNSNVKSKRKKKRKKRAVVLALVLVGAAIFTAFQTFSNAPSAETVRRLSQGADLAQTATEINTEGINKLNGHMISVYTGFKSRIDNQVEILSELGGGLRQVQDDMVATMKRFNNHLQALDERLLDLNRIKTILMSRVLPMLHQVRHIAHRIEDHYELWSASLLTLSRGYLPSGIISREQVNEILQTLVTQTTTHQQTPVTLDVNAYYNMKRVLATRYGNERLLIGLEIPMRRSSGGSMKLWRVLTFPVELNAGLKEPDAATQEDDDDDDLGGGGGGRGVGQSLVTNLPDFIAFSDTGEEYIEMSLADYAGCSENIINGKQTCGRSVKIVSNARFTPSCAYAIFNDATVKAREVCEIAYEPTRPSHGSARQLGKDDTFLMVADPGDTTWRIYCPEIQHGETMFLLPTCSLCRVKIPCDCSLMGASFVVPKRITGCLSADLQDDRILPAVTEIHRNILPVIEERSRRHQRLSLVRSFESRVDELYPFVEIEPVVFHVEDKIPVFLSREEKFQSDYKKIRAQIELNHSLYKDRFDEAFAVSSNLSGLSFFSDFKLDLPSLQALFFSGLQSLFEFFALITAPFVLSYIAFCTSLIIFIVFFFPALLRCLQRRRGLGHHPVIFSTE
jgi:hypothetical protein